MVSPTDVRGINAMVLHQAAVAAAVAALAVGSGRLENGDRLVSVELENVPTLKVLDAIAIAGGLQLRFDGPEDCCVTSLSVADVPLKFALEAVAAQGDVSYTVVDSNTLHVHLPTITLPQLLTRTEPFYPQDARDARLEGSVVVGALIRDDGNVESVEILSGEDNWPSFAESATNAVRERCYSPATKDGFPIPFHFVVRVDFRLR